MPTPCPFALRILRCGTALLCLGLAVPGQAADSLGELAELKRAVAELRAQNLELARRVASLEAEKSGATAGLGSPSPPSTPAVTHNTMTPSSASHAELAQRVSELEQTKLAQQDATRAIIRDSLASAGSKINSAVALGGAIEVLAGRKRDFSGATQSVLKLNTAELDFDIQANDWASARMVLAYQDGSDPAFSNLNQASSGIERVTVDTASLTIGDVQRFPLYLQGGKLTLDFGSTTGVHRSDVLSIESPLTTEAFETKRTAIGFGFALPTPAPSRSPPPVAAPLAQAQLLAPLVSALGRQLGYQPLPQPTPTPNWVSAPPAEAPFYGRVFFYEGGSGAARSFARNLNARLGYRSSGHCGRPYSDLRSSDFCPWSVDINLDYNSSVFASQFLANEYGPFLDQIGLQAGMASTLKLALGPLLVVGEWNGAISHAVFDDAAGVRHAIKPSAWQLSLAYQFDWNPWLESIGGQGSYLALGYSHSSDLAGVIAVVDAQTQRVGYLPRSRWTFTAGEWVLDGLRVALEYSYSKDYPASQGGTGASGNGLQMISTYAW